MPCAAGKADWTGTEPTLALLPAALLFAAGRIGAGLVLPIAADGAMPWALMLWVLMCVIIVSPQVLYIDFPRARMPCTRKPQWDTTAMTDSGLHVHKRKGRTGSR